VLQTIREWGLTGHTTNGAEEKDPVGSRVDEGSWSLRNGQGLDGELEIRKHEKSIEKNKKREGRGAYQN
jgi:hypothetical protein